MGKHLIWPLWPLIFLPSVPLPHAHRFLLECSTQTVLCSQILLSLQGSAQIPSLPLRLPDWTIPRPSSLDSCCGAAHFWILMARDIFCACFYLIHQGLANYGLCGKSAPTVCFYAGPQAKNGYCIFKLLKNSNILLHVKIIWNSNSMSVKFYFGQ